MSRSTGSAGAKRTKRTTLKDCLCMFSRSNKLQISKRGFSEWETLLEAAWPTAELQRRGHCPEWQTDESQSADPGLLANHWITPGRKSTSLNCCFSLKEKLKRTDMLWESGVYPPDLSLITWHWQEESLVTVFSSPHHSFFLSPNSQTTLIWVERMSTD